MKSVLSHITRFTGKERRVPGDEVELPALDRDEEITLENLDGEPVDAGVFLRTRYGSGVDIERGHQGTGTCRAKADHTAAGPHVQHAQPREFQPRQVVTQDRATPKIARMEHGGKDVKRQASDPHSLRSRRPQQPELQCWMYQPPQASEQRDLHPESERISRARYGSRAK